jgi:hypothetical protein
MGNWKKEETEHIFDFGSLFSKPPAPLLQKGRKLFGDTVPS